MADVGGTSLPTSNLTGYIRGLIAAGETPTSGLSIFREEGGHIMTQRWYELYGAEYNLVQQYPETLALDPDVIPNFAQYTPFEMGTRAGFAARVQVTMYNRDLGSYERQWFTYTSAQPFTPAEAAQAAQDQFSGEPLSSRYPTIAVGAVVARVGPTIPYQGG